MNLVFVFDFSVLCTKSIVHFLVGGEVMKTRPGMRCMILFQCADLLMRGSICSNEFCVPFVCCTRNMGRVPIENDTENKIQKRRSHEPTVLW